jgi:hypothetical protein
MTEQPEMPRSPWSPTPRRVPTPEEKAHEAWIKSCASIRYGVLDAMRLIRRNMMKPGEWDDPGIPSIEFLERAILKCGSVSSVYNHVEYARYNTALRWLLKRERIEREQREMDTYTEPEEMAA